MTIDFTFSQDVEDARQMMREFLHNTVKKEFDALSAKEGATRDDWSKLIKGLRTRAREEGFWLPHMPQEVGGMGLGVTALAAVSAEAAKVPMGPYIINCQAPDEGNMHTLYHFATEYQREHYLNPLLEGTKRSCFSMTEPEVAGSDPTLIQRISTPNQHSHAFRRLSRLASTARETLPKPENTFSQPNTPPNSLPG